MGIVVVVAVVAVFAAAGTLSPKSANSGGAGGGGGSGPPPPSGGPVTITSSTIQYQYDTTAEGYFDGSTISCPASTEGGASFWCTLQMHNGAAGTHSVLSVKSPSGSAFGAVATSSTLPWNIPAGTTQQESVAFQVDSSAQGSYPLTLLLIVE